jgi:hypothetical protein
MRLVSVLLFLVAATACQRPTGEDCERLCWRYNELHFQEATEKQAEGLSEQASQALRAERDNAWAEIRERKTDPGRENCVRDCRRGGKRDQVACVDQAETAAAARTCLE